MSVRRERFRCPKTGKERFYWRVDIVFDHPDGSLQRVRKASPVNTRKGAEQYERQIRQQLLKGTYTQRRKEDALEKEGAAAPTVPTAPTLKFGATAVSLKPGATGATGATAATGATGAAMATGAIEAIEVAVPTFKTFSEEFMTVYAQTNNKPSEVQSKESILGRHLLPAFGQMRLDEIKQRDIERYKSQKLALDLSPKTINNQLTVLRRLLAVAVEWEIIPVVPPIKWLRVPPQSFDFLDFEEAERLLAAAEEEWRPMITLAFRSGLRQGELLALRWGDVDLEVGQLVVRRAVARGLMGTPKNGRTRAIPLSEATVAALLRAPLPFRRGGGGGGGSGNGSVGGRWGAGRGGGGGRGGGRGGGLGNGRSWGLKRRERVKAGEGERRDEDLIFCDSMGNLL
ncbi:MAG: site-specific integrase, partial [Polyangia bacterium]|nr:site-specific integrase [Polyangia bacterium]